MLGRQRELLILQTSRLLAGLGCGFAVALSTTSAYLTVLAYALVTSIAYLVTARVTLKAAAGHDLASVKEAL